MSVHVQVSVPCGSSPQIMGFANGGFQTGPDLSKPLSVRSIALTPGSESHALASSALENGQVLQPSSSEEVDVLSIETGQEDLPYLSHAR